MEQSPGRAAVDGGETDQRDMKEETGGKSLCRKAGSHRSEAIC